jgi:hypothetical protein
MRLSDNLSSSPTVLKSPRITRGAYPNLYGMMISLQNDIDRRLVTLINSRFSDGYVSVVSGMIAADTICKSIMNGLKSGV